MIRTLKQFLKKRFPLLPIYDICLKIIRARYEQKRLLKKWSDGIYSNRENLKSYERQYFSGSGEDGINLYLTCKMNCSHKTFIEVGAGTRMECMGANLALCQGWSGVFIDAAEFESRAIVDKLYASIQQKFSSTVFLDATFITKENVEDLLKGWLERLGCDGIDFLSIDINGNDYYILDLLLQHIKPQVICIEYNGSIPPDKALTIPYIPDFDRDDIHQHYHGVSLLGLVKACRKYNYALTGTDSSGTNAFFVNRENMPGELIELSAERAFNTNSFRDRFGTLEEQFAEIEKYDWVEIE